MGQALYRKYRPRSLAEAVGQEHITVTLARALESRRIGHAYLFTGPRGTGKTSVARILAHQVNGLDYDDEATHLDIIEIDAASNRRIDEIRELRDKVHTAPTSAKYKVYIIDEVHMLTREAFNALLKTLEEPPAHAIFILATTEIHKVPETIISRTQRFTFKPVEHASAVAHLRHIAKGEGIDISDEALDLIAAHGGGSFRDSISLLDQLGSGGAVVDLAATQRMLGIAPAEAIDQLLGALQNNSAQELIATLADLYAQGYQATQIAKQLGQVFRQQLLDGETIGQQAKLLRKLLDIPASHDPNALLEIVLLDIVLKQSPAEGSQSRHSKLDLESSQKKESLSNESPTKPTMTAAQKTPTQHKPNTTTEPKPEKPAPTAKAKAAPKPTPTETNPPDETTWPNILQALKQKYNTLYGIARMAEPLWDGDTLTLSFSFAFHQKRVDEPKNKQIIRDILYEQTGRPITLTCVVEKKAGKPKPKPEKASSPDSSPLDTISNIFGGGEVLE